MFSEAYKRYVLIALTLVYALNFLDRLLMMLLLQPIKEELHLSDTQLGFLTGIAFGLFYALLGLPIARWADRGNRATITSLAIALWGVTVMACVFVSNFVQLVLARIAAAVGEAGCMPPTYSLIGDYYPGKAERMRAMAIYMLASPLAALISFVLGGWLNERFGWRMTFFVMGAPALLVALLVKATVIEPRTRAPREALTGSTAPGMAHVLVTLWRRRSCRNLCAALVLLLTLGYGLGPWYAAFMIRSHGMSTGELGLWLGLIFCFSGIVGIGAGGYVVSRWFAEEDRAQVRLSAVVFASIVPCFALFLLTPDRHQALAALALLQLAFNFILGPTFALMQRLVSAEMRATSLALVMLFGNLVGMGLGPQVVGVLSDLLLPQLGSDSLRYAMLAMSFVALWAAWHLWRIGRTITEDLSSVDLRNVVNTMIPRKRAAAGGF
jgi:MFS family permease